MLHTCTKCDGAGVERRKITNPMSNVYGWTRIGYSNWYTRTCETCKGEGFIEHVTGSVPLVRLRA
jgi:DnaJ-class molecular chaperone